MKKLLAATVVAVLVLTMTTQVMAQEVTGPLSGAAVGMGARSAAMGGAFVAVADDATALYWNPAGLTENSGLSWTNSVVGRAKNLDVVDDAKDVYDIVKEMDITPGDFNFIRGQAQKLADKPVSGNVAGISSVGWRNIALGVYGIGSGGGALQYAPGTTVGTIDGVDVQLGEKVEVQGSALWQYSTGGAVSRALSDQLAVGVTVRKMHLRYRAKRWKSEVVGTPGSLSIQTTDTGTPTSKDTATVVDLGLRYAVEPRVTMAAVVRNVTSPNFTLRDRAGLVVARYDADAVIDLGLALASEDGKRLLAFDIHNIGGRNDGSGSVHVGYERQIGSVLILRHGATQSTRTYGLGLDLGFLQLDLAAGTGHNDAKQAGLSANLEF